MPELSQISTNLRHGVVFAFKDSLERLLLSSCLVVIYIPDFRHIITSNIFGTMFPMLLHCSVECCVAPYTPVASTEHLFPGTWYLVDVDDKHRRRYDRVPLSPEKSCVNGV